MKRRNELLSGAGGNPGPKGGYRHRLDKVPGNYRAMETRLRECRLVEPSLIETNWIGPPPGEAKLIETKPIDTLKIPNYNVWGVANSNVTCGKRILKKEIDRKGNDVFVYLTAMNKGSRIMRDIQIIDPLPNDATDLVVFTPNNLAERLAQSLVWEINYLDGGANRVFHYKMNSNSNKIPTATSRWMGGEFKGFSGFEDFEEVVLRVGGKK